MVAKALTLLKPNRLIVFLLVVMIFGSFDSFGQERNPDTQKYLDTQIRLDSLWSVWKDETKLDSLRLDALGEYTWSKHVFSAPDSSLYYGQIEYELAKKIRSETHIAHAYKVLGTSQWVKGDYPKSLNYFERELAIEKKLGDKAGIAATLNKFGIVHSDLGNNIKALAYFEKSLKLREEIGNKQQLYYTLNSLGDLYYEQGNTTKAIEYFEQCLAIERDLDLKDNSLSLNNIGKSYARQGDYDTALDYFLKSLKKSEAYGDMRNQALTLGNIGNVLKNKGDILAPMEYFKKSLVIREKIGSQPLIAETLSDIGELYTAQKLYSKGITNCKRGYDISLEMGDITKQKTACKCLYDAYKALNNDNKALAYHEKMLVLNDSLKSEETSKNLQQMEFAKTILVDSIAKAETARKIEMEHQEELRKNNQTRNISIGIGAFILFLTLLLYNRLKFVRRSKASLQVEKDRSENLLLNILPAEIAQELKESGKAKARDFDMVSILFTDFKSFTQNSSKLNAQELVAEINTCFEAFDGIMEKFGIEKIKTIGDAYMAAGGLPIYSEDSIKNTVLAGLEMQSFITARFANKTNENEIRFEMRLGIHTGPVVAGIVGVKKFQYDIWGNTVNIASRMESNSVVGKVNISQHTFDLIKDDPQFTFESRGKINVKGKGDMEMYFVSADV